MNINAVDVIIIVVVCYFICEGYRRGFISVTARLISLLGSLLIALRLYPFTAELLRNNFTVSHIVSNAFGFLITAILAELILGLVIFIILERIPEKVFNHKFTKVLGIIPAFFEGLIIVLFFITLAMALPIQPKFKTAITSSEIGSEIVFRTAHLERTLSRVFGEVIENSLTYLTVKPQSSETVSLNTGIDTLTIDAVSEAEMFQMVNEERVKEGSSALIWDPELVAPARAHARDMWQRKYFSHISPEGKDVGDRMKEFDLNYFIVGENLALAPTLETAHEGLMNSPGHKANILEQRFGRVGIGVIDNGVYGKMFVQVFAD